MSETVYKKRRPVTLPAAAAGSRDKAAVKLPPPKQPVTHLPASKRNTPLPLPAYGLVKADEVILNENDFEEVLNDVDDNGTRATIRAKLGSREEQKRTISFELFLTPAVNYRISRVDLKVWFAEHRECQISKLAQLPNTRERLKVHQVHPRISRSDEADYTSSSAVSATAIASAPPPASSSNVTLTAAHNNTISGKAYARILGTIHEQTATWNLLENEKSRTGLESPQDFFHVTVAIPPSLEEDRVLMCCMLTVVTTSEKWYLWSKKPQVEPRYLVWGGHKHAPA